jgi:macrolide-specific efflux system membrane fusion protein
MKNKILLFLIILAAGGIFYSLNRTPAVKETFIEVKPVVGDIAQFISASGLVEPKNRLEVLPPLNGRIDKIYVVEGQLVKKGQTLALMSSTDHATLLDTARSQGSDQIAYWEKTYKPTPIISPISGKVIVRDTEPGQTINTSKPILVLADQLIIKAQVDETDIGRVKVGQNVLITLDAYPDTKIDGQVSHISFESKIVNNVTIYEVTIALKTIPDFLRSGMSTNVNIIRAHKKQVIILPEAAVIGHENKSFVWVKDLTDPNGRKRVPVTLGISQDAQLEIVSGIKADETILIRNAIAGKTAKPQGSFLRTPGSNRPNRR